LNKILSILSYLIPKSIANRLLATILVVTLVPTAMVGWIGYTAIYENIRQEKIKAVGFVAEERRDQLIQKLKDEHRRAGQFIDINVPRCKELFAPSKPKIDKCLQGALEIYTRREGALGASLHIEGRKGAAHVGLPPPDEEGDLKMLPGQLAIFPPAKPGLQRSYYILETDPISHSSLAMNYPVESLDEIFVPPHLLGVSGETFLSDADGFFITKPRYSSNQGKGVPISAVPMEKCLQFNNTEMLELDYRAVPIIHGFRYIPEINGGCIMAHFDQAEAFAPLKTITWALAFISVLITLLAFMSATYISRRMSNPIIALHRVTLRIIGGNHDAFADETGNDEIAELGQSFNLMTRQIIKHEQELEGKVQKRTVELELSNADLMAAIDELEEAQKKIKEMAFYDSLTQLPNRRLLNERLERSIIARGRNRHYGALLFLDLDNFKILNDTHGHQAGDELLIKAAKRLKACVRESDTVARLGGDEFIVLLEDLDASRDDAAVEAKLVAKKITSALSDAYELENVTHKCTVSIGIVLFVDPESKADAVLSAADAAMYDAKKSGKNVFRLSDAFADPKSTAL
jgi:diguanylate cyclase (GGDEF)-like protein